MTYGDLDELFKARAWGDDDNNIVKLALLYCIHLGLPRNDNWKLISQKVLQLVDHTPQLVEQASHLSSRSHQLISPTSSHFGYNK